MAIQKLSVPPGVFRQINRLADDCSQIGGFDEKRWQLGLACILGADKVKELTAQQEQGITHQLAIDWSAP